MKMRYQTLPPSAAIDMPTRRGRALRCVAKNQPTATHTRRDFKMMPRRNRLLPIVFFQAYLSASALAFAFGPIDFEIANPWQLYCFVFVAQCAILLGYLAGRTTSPRGYCGWLSVDLIMKTAIVATLTLLPATLHYHNYAGISFADALRDPGIAYQARLESFEGEIDAPLLFASRVLLAPCTGLFVPVGILYWRRMTSSWRALWCIGFAGLVVESVFSGAAVRLFDLVLLIPWILWLRVNNYPALLSSSTTGHSLPGIRRDRWRRVSRALIMLMSVMVILAGFSYFSHSRKSRYSLAVNEYPPFTTGWSTDRYGVPLPEWIEYPAYVVTNYWTQGYDGLADCLELPFEWTCGVGHSLFWRRCLDELGLVDANSLLERTYPGRLEAVSGYRVANYWHTIYPWLASDLTFPGAIVFMGLMGVLLAQVWSDALWGANPFAVGFLGQILMLFFYLPANSGRLSFPEQTLAFWGLLLLWRVTRRR